MQQLNLNMCDPSLTQKQKYRTYFCKIEISFCKMYFSKYVLKMIQNSFQENRIKTQQIF